MTKRETVLSMFTVEDLNNPITEKTIIEAVDKADIIDAIQKLTFEYWEIVSAMMLKLENGVN